MRLTPLDVSSVLVLLTVSGCVGSDGPSFFVVGNGTLDDECTIDDTTFLARGGYNPKGPPEGPFGYTMYPVFVNQLSPTGRTGRAEPNHLQVTGVAVTLEEPGEVVIDLGDLPNPYTVDVSATVEVGDGNTPSRQGAAVDIIPSTYSQALSGMVGGGSMTIIVRTEFFGTTVGGVDVDAPDWTYQIAVSNEAKLQCSLDVMSTCSVVCQDDAGCPSEDECECGLTGKPPCAAGLMCSRGMCVSDT